MTSAHPNPPTIRGYFHITVGKSNLNSAAKKLMKNDDYADGCLTRADELEDASGKKYILAPFCATDVTKLQAEVKDVISNSDPTITQASVTRHHGENDNGGPDQGNDCAGFDVDDDEPELLPPGPGSSNRWG